MTTTAGQVEASRAAREVLTYQAEPSVELTAMQIVADALVPLDVYSRRRVLKWAQERFSAAHDGNLAMLAVYATIMGEMAQAIDAHEAALRHQKKEPSVTDQAMFDALKKVRGE